jgi:hypothetical protein
MTSRRVNLLKPVDIEARTLGEPRSDAYIQTIMGFRIEGYAWKARLHWTGFVKQNDRLITVDAQQT